MFHYSSMTHGRACSDNRFPYTQQTHEATSTQSNNAHTHTNREGAHILRHERTATPPHMPSRLVLNDPCQHLRESVRTCHSPNPLPLSYIFPECIATSLLRGSTHAWQNIHRRFEYPLSHAPRKVGIEVCACGGDDLHLPPLPKTYSKYIRDKPRTGYQYTVSERSCQTNFDE